MGPELQNSTLVGRFLVPSFKTREIRPTRRHQILANSPAIPTSFQFDLANFGDQNNQIWHRYTRSGDFRHDLREKSLALMKSSPDRVRFCRFWPFFGVFHWVSSSLETDATCWQTDMRNLTLLTGRLRVGFLPTQSRTGQLQVGHKLDPPDLWTPLESIA